MDGIVEVASVLSTTTQNATCGVENIISEVNALVQLCSTAQKEAIEGRGTVAAAGT